MANRWPDTCNFCGAPLMSGRCPRCGYQRKKEGQSVYTAQVGGFPGGPGIQYVPLGTIWAAGTTVSIANVTMPARGLLCVYTVSVNDSSVGSFATVTWGAQALDERQGGGVDLWRAGLKATLVDPGTRTITMIHNDPAITSVGMIVFGLTGASAYLSATEVNSGGTPVTTIAYTKSSNVQAGRITTASFLIDSESAAVATLTGTGTVRQTLSLPDSVESAFLYHVAQVHADATPFTLNATLPVARDWYIDGHTLR